MRKAFVAAMELGRRVSKMENEVVCLITEPSRYKNRLCSLPRGFKSISSSSLARAAIFWRGGFDILKLEDLCSDDCATGIIKVGRINMLLVSGYLDINLGVVPAWLIKIINYSNKKKYPILFGLDTNAHSTLYGPVSNTRGEELEEFIVTNGLNTVNVGETPTFETIRGGKLITSFIDVTLTYKLTNSIKDWWVDQSYNLSLIHI